MPTLVTGATGFVGRRLLESIAEPVVLSRDPDRARATLEKHLGRPVKAFAWDAEHQPAPAEAFADVDTVFHLAGEPVAEGRWTSEKKRRLRDSRELGTRNLVRTLAELPSRPRVLISASAVGYYGNRGDEVLDEASSPGSDFLAEVCQAWERESHAAEQHGIRVVNPRIGIVLGRGGGALAKMMAPFKLGLGSPLGSGKQWMPWIHIDDLVGLMLFAAERTTLHGPVNATAPNPVTNADFTRELAKAVHRPAFLPSVPGIVLRTALGELSEVLLGGQRAVPTALLTAGYEFRYTELSAALKNVVEQ